MPSHDPAASAFPSPLLASLHEAGIIATVTIDDPADAEPLAHALAEGGIRAVELTLRTPAAFAALARIKQARPDLVVGLGTVIHPDQVTAAVEAGAAFGVAPGLNPEIIAAARVAGLPFAPGIATPSDIEAAISADCRVLKFFPAEPSGGLAYLKSIADPYAHLGLTYIPLGGLTEANFTTYLAEKFIPAIGGSWIAPRAAIQSGQWGLIRQNATRAVQCLATLRATP